MKYRFFIILLLLVAAALGITVGLVRRVHGYQRAVYHGRHVSEWAADLFPNFDPRGTNEALQAIRALSANAVPALRSQLQAREPFYEKPFVQNAGRIPVSTRRYLYQKIEPGQSFVGRLTAARALGVIGPAAVAAVPDLIASLKDPTGEIRWAAAEALSRLGVPGLSALAAVATNENAMLRQAAVYGLGEAGTNAAPSAGVIIDRVLDPDESVGASALEALRRIGPAAVPAVLAAFSDSDSARRSAAVMAIQAMNRPPRQITRTLLEFATNASPTMRWQSLAALQGLRLEQPRVLAAYVLAMNDPDPVVRAAAVQAISQASGWTTNAALAEVTARTLGLEGSLGSTIVGKLNGLLVDAEPSVRSAARRALTEIQITSPN